MPRRGFLRSSLDPSAWTKRITANTAYEGCAPYRTLARVPPAAFKGRRPMNKPNARFSKGLSALSGFFVVTEVAVLVAIIAMRRPRS
jgi:hypothetical protein